MTIVITIIISLTNDGHIAPSSRVRYVILSKGVATGVRLYGADVLITVKPKNQYLMAAGIIHTTQLLQISSIGPMKLLYVNAMNLRQVGTGKLAFPSTLNSKEPTPSVIRLGAVNL